jgi:asparagine synthase (glutamine-hydrolysing)
VSGFAGVYNMDQSPADASLVRRMTDLLGHRGPDGAGQWVDGPVGLGHRMLHSTPESLHERQPLLDSTGNLCLVLDGRVDNREELTEDLAARGIRLRADTDAELVLAAYACWGEQCPRRILGDFAFAVWDARARLIFCARDPLGLKPFYYAVANGAFLFCSEMRPIVEVRKIKARPNMVTLGLYLCKHFDEREETLYEGIQRLPAAHSLVVRGGTLRKSQYWDVDPTRTIRFRNDSEYADAFLQLFSDAVRCRLRSHRPVGAWLSGGLDSSSIVATAQTLRPDGAATRNDVQTFSIDFHGLPCSERPYIDEVVHHSRVSRHVTIYEQNSDSVQLTQATQYPDVFYEPMLFVMVPGLREMRRRGLKVVLDGVGGDELLAAGFDHITDTVSARRFGSLIDQISTTSSLHGVSPRHLVVQSCIKPMVPRFLRGPLGRGLDLFRTTEESDLIRSEFADGCGLTERLRRKVVIPRFATRSQQRSYRVLFYGWNAALAWDQHDLFVAQFQLESRRPFLDQRLVEFLLAVPTEQRWGKHQTKFVLREAMRGVLPEPVRTRRTKTDLSPALKLELQRQRCGVEELFRDSRLERLGLVEAGGLVRAFRHYCTGKAPQLLETIEIAISLEMWCRSAFEDNPVSRREGNGKPFGREGRAWSQGPQALFAATTH